MGASGNPAGDNPNRNSLLDLKNFQFTFDVSNFIEPDVGCRISGSVAASYWLQPCSIFIHYVVGCDTYATSCTCWTIHTSLAAPITHTEQDVRPLVYRYLLGTKLTAVPAAYAYPNDIPEQERLAFQGPIIKNLFEGRLYFAPLSPSKPPQFVLDVATGVGDWAIEMGDLFPSSEVVGTDLSPIQPDMVPPNVNFYVEDSSESWDYTDKFGYIHTRLTAGSWGNFQKEVAEQAFQALEPGGWLESQEVEAVFACDDGTLDPAGPMCTWLHEMRVAAENFQRPAILGSTLKEVFESVGFVDVQQLIFKMPMNEWPKDERLKEIGRMWGVNFSQGLNGFSIQLMNKVFGRTPAEIELSLVKIREELADPRVHAYMPVFVVWGRKPFAGEQINTMMT
ncbi:S-adenosyl-L-methionine-dependent methyltransferase [Trichoderma velutinum]